MANNPLGWCASRGAGLEPIQGAVGVAARDPTRIPVIESTYFDVTSPDHALGTGPPQAEGEI